MKNKIKVLDHFHHIEGKTILKTFTPNQDSLGISFTDNTYIMIEAGTNYEESYLYADDTTNLKTLQSLNLITTEDIVYLKAVKQENLIKIQIARDAIDKANAYQHYLQLKAIFDPVI